MRTREGLRVCCLLATILLFPTSAWGNSCVTCHGRLKQDAAQQAYRDWQGSVHSRAGVTCDRCHGGDPAAPGRKRAHQGIRGLADPQSGVQGVRILQFCKGCHGPQFREFTRSRHYKVLNEGEKQGPTCITCHGSMHTSILEPDNVAQACRRCHNQGTGIAPSVPEQAHATLDLIFFAKNTVQWSGEFVRLAREQGFPAKEASEALQEARQKFHLSEVKWHAFDFQEILKIVDASYEAAKRAKRLADQEVTKGALKRISKDR